MKKLRIKSEGYRLTLLALLAASSAWAAQPVLKEMRPLGAQRGKPFTLTLKGEGLAVGAELITTLPGSISRLGATKEMETPATELAFLVQLPADAPTGLYPVRLRTEDGLTNLMIFSVGDLPEISEKEPNNTIPEAQPISVPGAVSGTLPLADRDVYSFKAKAHERLVFEVEARRIGSAIDPELEVFDSTGRRIGFNDDAPGLGVDSRLELTFPKAGTYYVSVHDSKFSEQESAFYRLKVGTYSYADGIFPLGWQRGKDVEVTLYGGNLDKPVKVHPNLNVPASIEFVPVSLPGPKPVASLPFHFKVSDYPETLAPSDGSISALEPSTVVNGRILKPGQVDRYKFKVSSGQNWLFDLVAASLGTSQLYGSITVRDAQGKKLTLKELSNGPDQKITFAVPEKVGEVTLEVADLRGQGGPSYGYRLLATPGNEDFTLRIVSPYTNVPARGTAAIEVVAERHGYNGPILLTIPDLPADFTVAGGNIAAAVLDFYEGRTESTTIGYLTLTANPDAKPRALQLSVVGQGGTPEHPIRRRAVGPGLIFTVAGEEVLNLTGDVSLPKPSTFPWLGVELPVAIGKPPPAALEIASRSVRAVQGVELPLEFKVKKLAGGVTTTNVAGLPVPSIKGLEIGREKDKDKDKTKNPDEGKILINSMVDTPLVKLDIVPMATLQVNGKEESVVAPAITVELVRAYTLKLDSDRVELKSGGKVELAGSIRREPSFSGIVKIKIGDPPERVSCPSVEVPNDKSDFHLLCEAAAGAQEGDFEVHLVSSATNPGHTDKRDCTVPPVTAHMVVAGVNKPSVTAANKPGQ